MNTLTPKVSVDSLGLGSKFPTSTGLSEGLYKGPIAYRSQKIPHENVHINHSRFFDIEHPSLDVFHTIFHKGWTRYEEDLVFEGQDGQYLLAGKFIGSSDESMSLRHDGLVGYRRYADQARHNALYFNIDLLKSIDSIYRITRLHLAFDIPLDSTFGHFFTTIDNFFVTKIAKTDRINFPFSYYDKNKDGSRTHYPEMLTKTGNKPSVHSRMYEKHMKEGLKQRMIRFEICFEGESLRKVGNNPEALIKYLEKEIGRYRLNHFEDVRTCNKLKEQYAENILKNQNRQVRNNVRRNRKNYEHLTPNLTDKLLREIKENSTAIPLELTDEIRKFLTDMFDKNIKMEPPQFKKKVNHDRIKNCRIRQRLRQRWDREGRERTEIREKRNRQGIRRRIDGLQQSESNHFQLDVLNLEGGPVFNKQIFYVDATGPPTKSKLASSISIKLANVIPTGDLFSLTGFGLAATVSRRFTLIRFTISTISRRKASILSGDVI